MAFVSKGLEALSPGGAMGTLFPANLLMHEASNSWRQQLTSHGDVRLLASIGDFGMFSQALVQVAVAVIRKSEKRSSQFRSSSLKTNQAQPVTRFANYACLTVIPQYCRGVKRRGDFFRRTNSSLSNSSWRILTPQQRLIMAAMNAAQTPTVDSLFDIAQGVQTGNRDVFLLDELRYSRLPKKERRFFRKSVDD